MISSSLATPIVCFAKPLGPWHASDLFKPDSVWDIEDLQMYSGPTSTGLDETEYLASARSEANADPVLCRGVVTFGISDVSRLSVGGREKLQAAVRARLSKKLSEWGSARSSKYRNPTSLEEVLAKEGVEVRIEVAFNKCLAAVYSTRRSNGTLQSIQVALRSLDLTYRR